MMLAEMVAKKGFQLHHVEYVGFAQKVFTVMIESPWHSEIAKEAFGFSKTWGTLQGIGKTRL